MAQQQPKVPSRGIKQQIPALYWARLSSIVTQRMPAFPNGLSAQVRLYLTPDGAVTEVVFVRHSGVDVFDRILERQISEYAVTAQERLPVPKDPKMRAGVLRDGVTLTIRSRFKGKAGKKAALPGLKRINFQRGLRGVQTPRIKSKLKAVKPTKP